MSPPAHLTTGDPPGMQKAPDKWSGAFVVSRGAEWTRTPDPLHAMQVRYQLRHSPARLLMWLPPRRGPGEFIWQPTPFTKSGLL